MLASASFISSIVKVDFTRGPDNRFGWVLCSVSKHRSAKAAIVLILTFPMGRSHGDYPKTSTRDGCFELPF